MISRRLLSSQRLDPAACVVQQASSPTTLHILHDDLPNMNRSDIVFFRAGYVISLDTWIRYFTDEHFDDNIVVYEESSDKDDEEEELMNRSPKKRSR